VKSRTGKQILAVDDKFLSAISKLLSKQNKRNSIFRLQWAALKNIDGVDSLD